MKTIPFTRFYMPNGRQEPDQLEVSDEAAEKFQLVRKAGCRMTVELLTTGHVSICVEDPELGDFQCAVCPNQPEQPRITTERLLNGFSLATLADWRKNMNGEEES